MRVLFDTSVIVPALVDQLVRHPACFDTFVSYTSGSNNGVCSTHCLAECYAVLTALPLPRRITPDEALALIRESIVGRMEIVSLDQAEYLEAIANVSMRGLSSGIIYDALHIAASIKSSCSRIYTYNLDHFRSLCPPGILLSTP
jgi:predicted nucleic acid-binding protein